MTTTEDIQYVPTKRGITLPHCEFDYDAVDRGNPLTAELERSDSAALASQSLLTMLQWVWGTKPAKLESRAAFLKFVAMSAVVRPDILQNKSYEEIADLCGCSKANIALHAKNFQREFGVVFRRSHHLRK